MQQPGVPSSQLEKWAASAPSSQFNAIAGALSGFTSGVLTCPLDVIKTKLQAQIGVFGQQSHGRIRLYDGLVGTARTIWKEEGFRGMYRGLGPLTLGYLPTWAVWFTIYNHSKHTYRSYTSNDFLVNIWSSITAGAVSTTTTNPIWVIKTRLMSQSYRPVSLNSKTVPDFPDHYRSTWDAAKKMYRHEGLKAFYSGMTPALLGLSHVAVQFPTYELLKTKFTGQGMATGAPSSSDGQQHFGGILAASVLSKMLASSATYPHEVIRTRLQTQRSPAPGTEVLIGMGVSAPSISSEDLGRQSAHHNEREPKYKGVIKTFRTILREEGWRAFYAGMGTNMTRAVPAATVTMLTYEFVMQKLNQYKSQGERKRIADFGHERKLAPSHH